MVMRKYAVSYTNQWIPVMNSTHRAADSNVERYQDKNGYLVNWRVPAHNVELHR